MNKQTLFPAFIVCLVLASAAVLLAGEVVVRPVEDDLWPTKGWATASPGSVGLDEQDLLGLDKDMAQLRRHAGVHRKSKNQDETFLTEPTSLEMLSTSIQDFGIVRQVVGPGSMCVNVTGLC